MEILGGWQDPCLDDGSGYRDLLRNREKIEEKADVGLPMRKFPIPQLVGLQIHHL